MLILRSSQNMLLRGASHKMLQNQTLYVLYLPSLKDWYFPEVYTCQLLCLRQVENYDLMPTHHCEANFSPPVTKMWATTAKLSISLAVIAFKLYDSWRKDRRGCQLQWFTSWAINYLESLWASLKVFKHLLIWSSYIQKSSHSHDKNLTPSSQKKLVGIEVKALVRFRNTWSINLHTSDNSSVHCNMPRSSKDSDICKWGGPVFCNNCSKAIF